MSETGLDRAIREIPAFTAHEHIGSLGSFGRIEGPFFPSDTEPSLAPGRTTIFDLLFSPYIAGLLFAHGARWPDPDALAPDAGETDFARAAASVAPAWAALEGTGVRLALEKALEPDLRDLSADGLEGALADPACLRALSLRITDRYADYWRHFGDTFRRTRTGAQVKPVHPVYLRRLLETGGGPEAAWTVPILRVDGLAGFYHTRRILDFSGAERAVGLQVRDMESLEALVLGLFDLADRAGVRQVKQLQAYYRPIGIRPTDRKEASEALVRILRERDPADAPEARAGRWPGVDGVRAAEREDTPFARCRREADTVQDYLLGRILEEAGRRGMPYQIHTGMTTLEWSDPAQLEPLFARHPGVRFVLLHTYPFQSAAACMARTHPNVWLDTSWQVLQAPGILETTLSEWIGMAPETRITLSMDATCLEEFEGAAAMTRTILARLLDRRIRQGDTTPAGALRTARRLLRDNAADLYGGPAWPSEGSDPVPHFPNDTGGTP